MNEPGSSLRCAGARYGIGLVLTDRTQRLYGVILCMTAVTLQCSGTAWLIAYCCIYSSNIDQDDPLFDHKHTSLLEFRGLSYSPSILYLCLAMMGN